MTWDPQASDFGWKGISECIRDNNFSRNPRKPNTEKQINNVDKTGLYYKMLPFKILSSKNEAAVPHFKKNKFRVSVLLCNNAITTHKLSPC